MKLPLGSLLLALCAALFAVSSAAAADIPPVYELRVYTTVPGRMPDLLKRFREHTCALFEKHGMVNVGYWLPAGEQEPSKLYYILEHRTRDVAKTSWAAFIADPEWKAVRDASEAAGRIVSAVESVYLTMADFSPGFPSSVGQPAGGRSSEASGRIFELRTYTCNDEKLDDLNARFRDHTMRLFAKHSITNLPYFHPIDANLGAGKTLIYLLAHDSVDAAKASWTAFRSDPDWIKAKAESEKAGAILAKPPESVFLTPTDFSPLK